jgi:ParB family chromosome partitioning protein
MDIKVPLNKLKFGQEDGEGINARVAGRLDGIEALAANLFARGQIENLVVKRIDDEFYSVSNGNRRLAAFHQMYGAGGDQLINCTLRDVDEKGAFEDSLTTAVTAKQLHPVDQYEAFARLSANEKTDEEIARQYGMTEKEVRQALALGRLSPKIRDAWRNGDIKADVAQAFTLGLDHKTQDKAFKKLEKDHRLYPQYIKQELGATDREVGELLDFVGADFYRECGGSVVVDLFGTSHVVSNPALLKQIAADKLASTCDKLKAEGWSWAKLLSDLPSNARWWRKSEPKALVFEGDEQQQLAKLRAERDAIEARYQSEDEFDYDEYESSIERLTAEVDAIEARVHSRSFSDKQKAKSGCIVDVDDGRLVILYGVLEPEEVSAPASKATKKASSKGAAEEPAEPVISNSLVLRLSEQLTKGTATALVQDHDLALSVLLAGFACYDSAGMKVSVNGMDSHELDLLGSKEMPQALAMVLKLKLAERLALVAEVAAAALDFRNQPLDAEKDDKYHGPRAICDAIDPKALNAALRGVFDAKDYFNGVSKALCLAAITDAMGDDVARQQSKNPKGDIAAFAIANVPQTGWLPTQLRAKGYDGPPIIKAKLPAPAPRKAKKAPPKKRAVKKVAKKAAKKKKAA